LLSALVSQPVGYRPGLPAACCRVTCGFMLCYSHMFRDDS
jgi:hypothetical protein